MNLLTEIKDKRQKGLLDYKWKVRKYVAKIKDKVKLDRSHDPFVSVVVSPFIYLSTYHANINKDKSLSAVCKLCTESNHMIDVNRADHKLSSLAHMFNDLIRSSRTLLMCYDCGTVARGVFFQLINAYRGHFKLNNQEIERLRADYYMQRYQGIEGINILNKNVHQIQRNCLFLCALQLGEDFGHIYVIEKIYYKGSPRYRIYQSCLNAFLLVDYIEYMDYASDLSIGIEIDQHVDALKKLISTPVWDDRLLDLFIHWFNFIPPTGPSKKDIKLFTSAYVIF